MNNDIFVDFADTEPQLSEGHTTSVNDKYLDSLILEPVDDPWAQIQQEEFGTAAQSSSYIHDLDTSPAGLDPFVQTHREAFIDHSSKAAYPLPYSLTRDSLQGQLEKVLKLLEPRDESDHKDTVESSDFIEPLHIDSTRTVWNKLTTVHAKRIKFDSSNVKSEMVAILRAWHTKAKNQPSWTRPLSIQVKKNRESIGPAIFGWGRTDVPAWVATPRTPRSTRFSPVVPATPVETPIQAVEDDSVDFGDFESAPPSAIMTVFDDDHIDETVAISPPNEPVQRTFVQGLGILDFDDLPVPKDVRRSSKHGLQQITMRDDGVLSTKELATTGQDNSQNEANPTAILKQPSSVIEPWDLSVFEKQLTGSNPVPVETKEESSRIGTEATFDSVETLGQTKEKKTAKEMADEATVERIVSHLPNLDYLLS